ncbi:MAG: D-alanyl-D-alanine carboxypeptidase, partial [Kitasatospora sp.]|nr:D-alanyl-D-alanine carboxypeptidase [Kitasatospora sp.]
MRTLLATTKRRLAAATRRVRRVGPGLASAVAAQRESRWSSLPPQTRRTWQVTAGATALGLVVAGGAIAVAGPWDEGQRTSESNWADAQGATGDGRHGAKAGRPRPAPH